MVIGIVNLLFLPPDEEALDKHFEVTGTAMM